MMLGGQYGEDRILKLFFRSQAKGFLVDVGAADGKDNSNSYMLLCRLGWRGILIEPESSQFAELSELYVGETRVQLVNCACGKEEGARTLYSGRQVSTCVPEFKAQCEARHKIEYQEEQVQVKTLQHVLEEKGVPREIDFMSIDCEGMNFEVWESLDQSIFCPKLVCIEGKGFRMGPYVQLCRMTGNTFYLREDLCDLL